MEAQPCCLAYSSSFRLFASSSPCELPVMDRDRLLLWDPPAGLLRGPPMDGCEEVRGNVRAPPLRLTIASIACCCSLLFAALKSPLVCSVKSSLFIRPVCWGSNAWNIVSTSASVGERLNHRYKLVFTCDRIASSKKITRLDATRW